MTFPKRLSDLAADVIAVCRARGMKVTAAESCTGGLVMGCLTTVPGSSNVVDRGFVTYADQAKVEMLGVDAALIAAHGAVSEETARAMAEGALHNSSADVSVAVTGIAGPGGGTPQKPVGLVHIAAGKRDGATMHQYCRFTGDREEIRMQAVETALNLLKKSAVA